MTAEKPVMLGKKEVIQRLTHADPKRRLVVSPLLSSKQLQPASIDVRLGPQFHIIKIGKITHLDPLRKKGQVEREVKKYTDAYKILRFQDCFVLHPGEFVLGATLEYLSVPVDIACRLEGRSSWGRLGILIHSTAGYIDPGFRGNVTLELKNVGKVPVPLFPGVRVGQLSLYGIDNEQPYRGKYKNSFGVKPSAYFEDPEYERLRAPYGIDQMAEDVSELFESGAGRDSPRNRHLTEDVQRAIIKAYRNRHPLGTDVEEKEDSEWQP